MQADDLSVDTRYHALIDESDEESHELALRRAARFMSQFYWRHLGTVGVSPPQFTILRRMKQHGELTMVELSDKVMIERSTLVRALQVLRKDGLIRASLGPPPGRRNVLSLTPKGAQVLEQARDLWRVAQREFEERFGAERAQRLRVELFDLTRDRPISPDSASFIEPDPDADGSSMTRS